MKNRSIDLLDSSGHSIGSVYSTEDNRILIGALATLDAYGLEIGHSSKKLPNLALKQTLPLVWHLTL